MLKFDERALKVISALEEAGYQAVLIGGCVRDKIMEKEPHDYDVATSARPEQVKEALKKYRWKIVDTGLRHGTVTVICEDLPVEVTTFRRDAAYSDHRRPDSVEFTDSLREDQARRDFSINAIAWEDGKLQDHFGGKRDIKLRRIRCVGKPDVRFEEDALRPLRGLRLAAQMDFDIEPKTAAAIRRHIPDLSMVAWERVSSEFVRLLCAPGAMRVLLEYPEAAVQIIPELAPTIGFDQNNYHHCYDLYTHILHVVDGVPPWPALRLGALLHDIGKTECYTVDEEGVGHFRGHAEQGVPLAREALSRLRLPNAVQDRVCDLVEYHHIPVENTTRWARRWLSRLGMDLLMDILTLKRADILASAPEWRDTSLLDQAEDTVRKVLMDHPCLSVTDLKVNGHDAEARGFSGPATGQALQTLLDEVLDEKLPNERKPQLIRLRQLAAAAKEEAEAAAPS